MTMTPPPPKLYVGGNLIHKRVCLFSTLLWSPVPEKLKEKKKETQSVVLCQDHGAFLFHQIEYWNGKAILEDEAELSVLMPLKYSLK